MMRRFREWRERRRVAEELRRRKIIELDLCEGGVCDYMGGLCNRHLDLAYEQAYEEEAIVYDGTVDTETHVIGPGRP